jgi:predicted nucleic acid-binding protein
VSGTLVDSSILLDVFEDDPAWYEWSSAALEQAASSGPLYVDLVIYSEVSVGFARIEELEDAVRGCGLIVVPIPKEGLFLAGKAFLRYRKAGGVRTAPLPDFFIGAHAAVAGYRLLTRDPRRIRAHFPTVTLTAPDSPAA